MAKKDNQKMKKEKEIPKAPEILEAEEEVKGVVEIDFNEEDAPIQNIKEEKKTRHRPIVSPISTIILPEKPNLQKIDITDPVTHIEIHDLKDAKIIENPQSLEDLEKEIIVKIKLLEQKKQEEEIRKQAEEIKLQEEERKKQEEEQQKKQEEEIRKQAEEIRLQEEEKTRIEQELIRKEKEEIDAIKKQTHEIRMMPCNEIFLKVCPRCNSKIKKGKVKQNGLILTQSFKCSDTFCDFNKEIILHL